MTVTKQKNEQDIIDNWDHPIALFEGDKLYKLLEIVAIEDNRIDLDIEEIYDSKFLETATGAELEKIGDLVGINRKTDEPDEKLRKRIQIEFAAQSSDTTFDVFASIVLSVLETNKDSVSITTPPESLPKVIILDVDGRVVDNSPFTTTEIKNLLNRTVSSDARVDIKISGTFAFAGDDDTLKGWDEGTWSYTTEI